MLDKYNRQISYLRLSITDRCNLRCTYCMPAEGVQLISHNDILSFEEIIEIVSYAAKQGIDKLRLTGGEPLLRKGIVELVAKISKIEGIKDFGLTTNGLLLPQYAQQLKDVGLHRLNISLDTLNPEIFKQITRGGNIKDVFTGIEAAKMANFLPIKINCVIKNSKDEPNAIEVAKFCKDNNLNIRYIREMDLDKGQFWQVIGGDGGKCSICNRLRITSNGKIKPCLFSDLEYDIRKLGIAKSFELALNSKPEIGKANHQDKFNNLGG